LAARGATALSAKDCEEGDADANDWGRVANIRELNSPHVRVSEIDTV
jgi:hypothetical protein